MGFEWEDLCTFCCNFFVMSMYFFYKLCVCFNKEKKTHVFTIMVKLRNFPGIWEILSPTPKCPVLNRWTCQGNATLAAEGLGARGDKSLTPLGAFLSGLWSCFSPAHPFLTASSSLLGENSNLRGGSFQFFGHQGHLLALTLWWVSVRGSPSC